MEADLHKRHY